MNESISKMTYTKLLEHISQCGKSLVILTEHKKHISDDALKILRDIAEDIDAVVVRLGNFRVLLTRVPEVSLPPAHSS